MFTGKRPFDGGTPEEIMLKALQAEVPSPSSVMRSQMNPVLHRSLENVCLKAIAKDPAERYPTAKAMADDLTRWLGGEDVEADVPQRRRRRRILTGIAVGAAAGLLLGLGGLLLARPSIDRELADAAELVRRGDFAAARTAYDHVLSRSPGRKEALDGKDELRRREQARRLEQAEKLLSEGRSSEAFDAFTLLLVEDPSLKRAQEGKEEAKRRMVQRVGDSKRP
jgi:hypothetical protein